MPSGGVVLSVTNAAGSWIMWERLRLVEAPTFALAHLGLARPLPGPSAALRPRKNSIRFWPIYSLGWRV